MTDMQINFLARDRQGDNTAGPRKLSVRKETLRRLTDGQLRQAAGGSGISAFAATSACYSTSCGLSTTPRGSVVGTSIAMH
jgi:hypothetical protein